MKQATAFVVSIIVLGASGIAFAERTITVDDDAPADFTTIQAAIDDANDGDTIIVQPGTYVENINFLGKNITLRSLDPNDTACIEATIIDGNDAGSVITFTGMEDDNCVLEGFTITRGYGGYQGGISGRGTIATIQKNIISNNTGFNSIPRQSASGGGISHCNGIIQDNVIINNYSTSGGGLADCSGIIRNNVISSNEATHGGGLYACQGIIRGNTISHNSGYMGGGLSACNAVIQDNYITNNKAGYLGGGLFGCDGAIENNTISGNRATGHGGGLASCDALICNNVIYANAAPYGIGGGLHGCDGQIKNNTICNNIGTHGGGGLSECDATIVNCIIWGNEPDQLKDTSEPLYTCLQSDTNDMDAQANPNFANPGYWDPNGTPQFFGDDFWVDGDYHLKSQAGRWDPTTAGWVRDNTTSPCIDAGDPMTPIGQEPFPNGGIINMGAYGGTAEASKAWFDAPTCQTIIAGDINGDCKVNHLDFVLLAMHWLEQH